MNNPTPNKESSNPSKSTKQFHRVEAQLARQKKANSEVIPEIVTVPVSETEINPASTLVPLDKIYVVEAETSEPVKIVPELQLRKVEQVDRKMLGKVKRALFKAGVEADPEAQAAFVNGLLMANVPCLDPVFWPYCSR
jgi:hypothetical protein